MEYVWRDQTLEEISDYQLERSSLVLQESIDQNEVAKYLDEHLGSYELFGFSDNWSPEKKTAYAIAEKRHFQELEWGQIAATELIKYEEIVRSGAKILKDNNCYWLFEPCIEKIFEMNQEQLNTLHSYLVDFMESEYGIALHQHSYPLRRNTKAWYSECENHESFNHGIALYQDCASIFERSFPNLLAMKRVLDGETPENRVLQRKSASSVRRELTDTTDVSNSIYFDLVVKRFDGKLRNGISHGDVVYDPSNEEIRIPTEDTVYTHGEFNRIICTNEAIAHFLWGGFISLVCWQTITNMDENITRAELEI